MSRRRSVTHDWRLAEQKIGGAIHDLRVAIRGRESGFTLIELITGVAIISLLTVVLSAIVVTAQRSAAIEKTRADLSVENRKLVDDTIRNIKNATSVLASSTVLGTNYTTGAGTLVLQIPAIDVNQSIITNVYDLLVFRRNGTNYEFIQDAGVGSIRPDTQRRVYSERVSSLTFTYLDATGNVLASNYQNAQAVKIASTLFQTVRGRTVTNTLTDTTTLRNK